VNHARLVIVGAGIVGTAAAYHLARLGWRDIVVLEQGPLHDTGGSTSHAPGLVFQTNPSRTMTEFAKYTVELYGRLQLDGQPCFHPVGSLEVATTQERMQELRRRLGFARAWGLRAELLTPQETCARLPLIDERRILGSYHVPSDGLAKAVRAGEAMAREAESLGTRFVARCRVTGLDVANGRVRAVETSQGRIETEQVLVCAGIWGPLVGRMAGVSIPLMPVQHIYTRTAPLRELVGETREIAHPILRHQDRSMYLRQHADAYGVGSYRHEPLLVEPGAIASHAESGETPAQMSFTPEHFAAARAAADELLPALRGAELVGAFNGMFSFTPDGFPLLGESLDVRGFWVAEAIWITHAGGAGRAIAELMHDGTAWVDLRECDLHRFPAYAHTPAYVRARGAQQYREVYDIIHPLEPYLEPRNLRRSPYHERLEALGAVFFESAGWERPRWFAANEPLLREAGDWPVRAGWEARHWSPIQGVEHVAARERVGLFDLTSFTKIEVTGPGALALLERLCANRIDRPIATVVYTSMLDPRGRIVCDLTVTRLGQDRFLVLTGAASGMHDLAWIRRHAAADPGVHVSDVTSAYGAVGLWGPRAPDVLRTVSESDLSFPYFTARRIAVGGVPALALRVSYVGEAGWEIYAPTDFGAALWDALWAAGRPFGMAPVGASAFDSLRLEKGYRLWGADIHTDYTPYEAGLGSAVRIDKGEFIGRATLVSADARATLVSADAASPHRRLCCLTFESRSAVVLGKEPVVDGDTVLGYVTSAGFGYSVDRSIAYAYLPISHTGSGTRVEVEYFGRRYPARVSDEPLYDPKGLRLRG
jgi:glycine cleavage system aminomethyltransferase T/glycine/D-amino acid oxidase-like deaminating enzyme